MDDLFNFDVFGAKLLRKATVIMQSANCRCGIVATVAVMEIKNVKVSLSEPWHCPVA